MPTAASGGEKPDSRDLGLAYAGAPLGNGSRFYRGFRPAHHAELVRRYLAAGLIVLGKTNTPELGLRPVTEPEASGPPEDPLRWSYGLVQLRGVPDGAAVDLDGRFWMTAAQLDRRWLALPHGRHVIAVYVEGKQPVERRVDVAAGRTHFVRFGPFADVRA